MSRGILPARFEFSLVRLRFVLRQTEPIQIHRRKNRSLKILFHAGYARLLLRIVLRVVVIEDNRVYLGFRGKFAQAVHGEMFLLHVRGKFLFAGRWPVVLGSHLVDESRMLLGTFLNFRNQNVGALRQFHHRITGPGVAGKYHHALGRLDAVRIGLEMCSELRRHERVMRILGGRDLNFIVTVNNAIALDLVGNKGTGQAMVRPAQLEPGLARGRHFKGNAEVVKGGFHQFAGLRRPVDIDLSRIRAEIEAEVIVGHHVGEAEIMVRVQVGKENRSNRFRGNSRLDQAADGPNATVNQVRSPLNHEQRGRLGAILAQRRTGSGPQHQQFGIVRPQRRAVLRRNRNAEES